MTDAPTFFSARQHGKSLLAEKEAMKAWREGKRVVQIRNEGGEQRTMIWIPKETDSGRKHETCTESKRPTASRRGGSHEPDRMDTQRKQGKA